MKVFLTGALLFFFACQIREPAPILSQKEIQPTALDSVPVYHLQAPVIISFADRPQAWQERVVFFSDSCRVIALLVEKYTRVRQGDLLASLWNLSRKTEFTPVDITAPMSGIVSELNCKLNDIIPPKLPIMILRNYENLILRINVHTSLLIYLKKGQSVRIYYGQLPVLGSIYKLDSMRGSIDIIVVNQNDLISPDSLLTGRIECGQVKGDFIPRGFFALHDTLTAMVDPDFSLSLMRLGWSDSLALIFPPLPDRSFIKITKKSLDLVK